MPSVRCVCGHNISYDQAQAGRSVECPGCGRPVGLPVVSLQNVKADEGLEVNFDWDAGAPAATEKKEEPSRAIEEVPAEPAAPKEEKGEGDFDWDSGLSLDGDEKAAAPAQETPAPAAPAAPAHKADTGAKEFDWGSEFSLGAEPEKPAAAPPKPAEPARAAPPPLPSAAKPIAQPATPAAPPAKPPAPRRPALEFSADEFSLTRRAAPKPPAADEEEIVDLDSSQVLAVTGGKAAAPPPPAPKPSGAPKAAGTPKAPPAPKAAGALKAAAPAAMPQTRICAKCGTILTAETEKCPDCGSAFGGGAAKRGTSYAPAWAESFWGAFGYAYIAVLTRGAWRAWLQYLVAGVGAPMLILGLLMVPIIGCCACLALPGAIVVMIAACVGGMYYYMAHAAANGFEPIPEPKVSVWHDMLMPLFLIVAANLVLGIIPNVISFALVRSTLNITQDGLKGPADLAKLGAAIAGQGAVLLTMLISFFCFPMVVMLLGASQSVSKSLNPVNVFKAVAKNPLHYVGLWVFYMFNALLAPVLMVLLMVTVLVGVSLSGMALFAFLAIELVVGGCGAIGVYLFAVNGWRMGMFLNRNPKVFEHVR